MTDLFKESPNAAHKALCDEFFPWQCRSCPVLNKCHDTLFMPDHIAQVNRAVEAIDNNLLKKD